MRHHSTAARAGCAEGWTSDAAPGRLHDVTGALYWAASQRDLPTLADSGYEGAGQGIHTPIKQPTDGSRLDPDNRAYNTLLRSMRCLGERGFALLTGRWRALRHTTASPSQAGDIVRAALVLTQFEHRHLPTPR